MSAGSVFRGGVEALAARALHGAHDDEEDSVYSMSAQLWGLLILFAASGCGAATLWLLSWYSKLRGKASTFVTALIYFIKAVGVGVVISTAMVHLIAEANEYFEEAGWSEKYESLNMVFAMIGLLIVGTIDLATNRKAVLSTLKDGKVLSKSVGAAGEGSGEEDANQYTTDIEELGSDGGWSKTEKLKSRITAVLMETSVIIHSVLIGFDLGIQSYDAWKTLIIAISFHQYCEGFALTQVIFEARYENWLKPFLSIFFFTLTTPIGVGIGIGVHHATTGAALAALLGVFNSLCGGFLLYLGLVSLYNRWFVDNTSLHMSPVIHSIIVTIGVILGMAAMNIIGIWA